MDFKILKTPVENLLNEMISANKPVFTVNVSGDEIWNKYLSSFPPGTNEKFREKTEYDCSCCKHFVRNIGGIVTIEDGELKSIWDVTLDGPFGVVAEKLSNFVKSFPIKQRFFSLDRVYGTDKSREMLDDGSIRVWDHFHVKLPKNLVGENNKRLIGSANDDKNVLERSLEEISDEAIDIVLDLIDQNTLYRGFEHKGSVESLKHLKQEYSKIKNQKSKDIFIWEKASVLGGAGRFKNTLVGKLMSEISDGVGLDKAVNNFEGRAENYKRPKPVVSKKMREKAVEKIRELGFESSLNRRYATAEDLTINNVLFADRSAKKVMRGVLDELIESAPVNTRVLGRLEEISIEKFIKDVLPSATSISVMMENSHTPNLVSLIAPVDENSKNMFKWGNKYSLSYTGERTDAMKENVKSFGGDTDGVLRYSIQWNEDGKNNNDLDAHCLEPCNNLIYFGNKGFVHNSSGKLDVDIVHPGGDVAVENIIYKNINKMKDGDYQFIIHNFNERGGVGWSAEIEFDGKIYSFSSKIPMRNNEKIKVATVTLKNGKFTINCGKEYSKASKEVWGVNTEVFNKVSMIMMSPNYWDGEATGNKHYLFMLDGCNNPEGTRGFYNEFLTEELRGERKSLELLSSMTKTEKSDNQLSGLGFSSTQRNSLICKVTGNFERTLKINF